MIGAKGNNSVRTVALGATVQSSTYGQTIPVIYGRIKSALYLIWEANIRQTSGKKGKGPKKGKKGQAQYSANVDFLIGHNPILTPLQFWVNQSQKLPLKFAKYTVPSGPPTVPDPNFYAVIAVTMTQGFGPITFNDYGSPTGSVTVSGTWEAPLWNAAYHGPDPAWPSSGRLYAMYAGIYYWTPANGNAIVLPDLITGLPPTGMVNIYYAQLWPDGSSQYGKKASGTDIPAAALNLTFEPILGDGPEYTGTDSSSGIALSSQQIFYPCYAGLGSQAYQSAQTGLPEVSAEVLGAYAINPQGDADFADMIEDLLKQGIMQPGFATSSDPSALQLINTHPVQRGLGCYNWPGLIQMFTGGSIEPFALPLYYFQPNAAGNILVVVANGGRNGATLEPVTGISDTAGNTWTPIPATLDNGQLWYATALAYAAGNQVTVGPGGYSWEATCFELGGVDTYDTSTTVTSGRTASITTGNTPGSPAFILAFANYTSDNIIGTVTQNVPLWSPLVAEGLGANGYMVYCRTVYQPGTYSFTAPITEITGRTPTRITLISFKATQPSPYARALGDILDFTTMNQVRAQCKANGLWGSLVMDSQQKASDWLDVLYKAANAAPVWSGFALKSIPYSEVSAAGNGAVYNAPTASGPVAALAIADFITDSGQPLYSIERKAQVDVPNLLQLQIPNRGGDYNDVVVSQPMTAAVALFGSRKDSPQQFRCIVDPAVARMILQIQVNKQNNLRNTYKFKLTAKWKLLEAMDLITLPADPVTGLPAVDVRLTKLQEDEKYQLDCEAEPFIYGTYAPVALPVTSVQPYQLSGGGDAGVVNAPIFLEPVPRLSAQSNQGQLWIVVSAAAGQIESATVGASGGTGYLVGDVLTVTQSGAVGGQVTVSSISSGTGAVTGITVTAPGKNYSIAANLATTGGHGSGAGVNIATVSAGYGGCGVYISTDGGTSYNQVGQIAGNAITGVSTADWPANADPDTTNDLPLDLSESDGALNSYQVADEDNFTYPCYIANGAGSIPYELMTYATASLTGTYQYTLKATGTGNHLRRSVFGAPTPGAGVDHPSGSRFAWLGPPGTQTQQGILKLNMDPNWIGKTLYFKFPTINALGAGQQSLTGLTAYSYTPTGVAQQNNPDANTYVNSPAVALSRSSSTVIALAQVTTQFPSNTVKYNARTFTIPAPSMPTTYYVTIADTGYVGDEGAGTTLTATCSTSNALVGVPGNTYMGFIKVSPSGPSADIAGPGGWPAPFTAVVGP